ncbi:type III restriction enzyme [Xylariaceae sp. FL1019]|nr:type III restriction enzyme [Xylariaceae sp. FL1019]
MDSDEFEGDDIADDDFVVAATTQPRASNLTGPNRSVSRNPTALERTKSFSTADVDEASRILAAELENQSRQSAFRPSAPIGSQTVSYRQTTLFGQTIQTDQESAASQPTGNRVFRVDKPPEPPTHHELDLAALKTWVYPTNLGPSRDYQYSIVKNGLFNNTLVALPTGLGKTFIAATIMLNYFRWMKTAKLVFVAPTKPLVSQQIDACFYIAGIPRSQTTLLTGDVSPANRAEEWMTKRVFFMTPQTLENDLSAGYADPKAIGLLVVDEAHRATGNYSYVKVVSFIRRFSQSFRLLALTATPGSSVEAVQEVIDGLKISCVEVRTEVSIDIKPYIHQRNEEIIVLDPSDEMEHVMELFSKALQPIVDKIRQQNTYYRSDPMSLTTFGLMKAKNDWMARAGKNANQGLKSMMSAIFAILMSLAHTIQLLKYHGIKPFFDNLVEFRADVENKGQKGSKYKRQIVEDKSFQEMMTKVDRWLKRDDFVGHPKLTYLSDTILNHFMDAGEGREGSASSNTRIIVFSKYRDSAEEIVRVLNTHKPLIRAAVFVGQADSKRSAGMSQVEQIQRIQKFKEGEFNVLVATSIGEEGLDIGQVDLIICNDASASPIQTLQRMGRTGRKRAGRVVLLLMRGKEQQDFDKSKDNYDKMQQMICEGSRFDFHHDLSMRIVPRDIRPEVDMRAVEIPLENTQQSGLPEPSKNKRTRKKKPPKKFHMPDSVETGFQTVAAMLGQTAKPKKKTQKRLPKEDEEVTSIPSLDRVLLSKQQASHFKETYQKLSYQRKIGAEDLNLEDISPVDLTAHPTAQKKRRKTVDVKHGAYTKRIIKMYQSFSKLDPTADTPDQCSLRNYRQLPLPTAGSDSDDGTFNVVPRHHQEKVIYDIDDDDDELEELSVAIARGQRQKPISNAQPRRQNSIPAAVDAATEAELPEYPQRIVRPKPTSKRRAPVPKKPVANRGRARTKKAPTGGAYDESADEGDDCRRTSDLELTDVSDSGADLEGFVVGDDMATSSNFVTSSIQRRSTSPTSPASILSPTSTIASVNTKGRYQNRQRYNEPCSSRSMEGSESYSESEDEMPSMSQVVRTKGRPAQVVSKKHARLEIEDEEDGDDDSDSIQRGHRAQKRRRNVVVDDEDSDE